MKNTLNVEHPIFTQLWESQILFRSADELPEGARYDWPELQLILDNDLKGFESACYFESEAGRYIVAKTRDGFTTYMSGPASDQLETFKTLSEAFQATFADCITQTSIGEWNDDTTEYRVNGEWLIRWVEAQ